jgi:hypothetical protein
MMTESTFDGMAVTTMLDVLGEPVSAGLLTEAQVADIALRMSADLREHFPEMLILGEEGFCLQAVRSLARETADKIMALVGNCGPQDNEVQF